MRALSVSQHEQAEHNERQPRIIDGSIQPLAEHEIREQRLNQRRWTIPHGIHPNDVFYHEHANQEINDASVSHTALNEQRNSIRVVGGTRICFELEIAIDFN